MREYTLACDHVMSVIHLIRKDASISEIGHEGEYGKDDIVHANEVVTFSSRPISSTAVGV